ncbi:cysteine hydrolase family protein [Curvivirga sp.]|uniref:cysteine hydrolase family protein n=1 Tax=Curvivirga sp. TaxID=2856848 RepID=UPI003B5BCFE8
MKTAVIVIDVQHALFEADEGPFEREEVIERINTLTSKARNLDVPVIMVQHEREDTVVAYQSAGWQLYSELDTKPTDVIVRKQTPDSFHETDLADVLKKNSVTDLIVCGYATEFCVDTTVRRAAALGYDVQLVADAHTTHDKDHLNGGMIRGHHNATLPNATSFSGNIEAVEAISVRFG